MIAITASMVSRARVCGTAPPQVTLINSDSRNVVSMDDLRTYMQQRPGHPQFSRSCHVVPRSAVHVVVLALLVFACGTARTFAMTDDQAIRAVLATQADAWNKGDLDGYMAGYANTDELVFTSGGHVRRGWRETFDKYRAKYGADRSTMGRLTF